MKNYHTHTYRCKHAQGDVVDYARAAWEKGITVLGMTDHTPLPDGRWLGQRMACEELEDYIRAIEHARDCYPNLMILKGLECEWTPEYHGFFRDELLGKHNFDYLVLGCHYFKFQGAYLSGHGDITDAKRLRAYADFLIRSMQSGLFAFAAHPDLFGLNYLTWDANAAAASRDILSAAKQLQLPLEINGYGLCRRIIDTPTGRRNAYPWTPFWEMAGEYEITAVVNSDAHNPDIVDLGLREGAQLAQDLGIELADLSYLH